MLCRHCNNKRANRPRNLCWSCYYAPGVREQYPSGSKFARNGIGNDTNGLGLPEPTDAMPGTDEKYRVLLQRARDGKALYHPLDAKEHIPRGYSGATSGKVYRDHLPKRPDKRLTD